MWNMKVVEGGSSHRKPFAEVVGLGLKLQLSGGGVEFNPQYHKQITQVVVERGQKNYMLIVRAFNKCLWNIVF
jgi:hypothetical protein